MYDNCGALINASCERSSFALQIEFVALIDLWTNGRTTCERMNERSNDGVTERKRDIILLVFSSSCCAPATIASMPCRIADWLMMSSIIRPLIHIHMHTKKHSRCIIEGDQIDINDYFHAVAFASSKQLYAPTNAPAARANNHTAIHSL